MTGWTSCRSASFTTSTRTLTTRPPLRAVAGSRTSSRRPLPPRLRPPCRPPTRGSRWRRSPCARRARTRPGDTRAALRGSCARARPRSRLAAARRRGNTRTRRNAVFPPSPDPTSETTTRRASPRPPRVSRRSDKRPYERGDATTNEARHRLVVARENARVARHARFARPSPSRRRLWPRRRSSRSRASSSIERRRVSIFIRGFCQTKARALSRASTTRAALGCRIPRATRRTKRRRSRRLASWRWNARSRAPTRCGKTSRRVTRRRTRGAARARRGTTPSPRRSRRTRRWRGERKETGRFERSCVRFARVFCRDDDDARASTGDARAKKARKRAEKKNRTPRFGARFSPRRHGSVHGVQSETVLCLFSR